MGEERWCASTEAGISQTIPAGKGLGQEGSDPLCGQWQICSPHLAEIGVDCFNPFQPEVMDIYSVKRNTRAALLFGAASARKGSPLRQPR